MTATHKKREIYFNNLHPEDNQAGAALLLLEGIPGIMQLELVSHLQLNVVYDIEYLTLAVIEDSLLELGFHLDNSLLLKLKRALYHYTEETERANLGSGRNQGHNTRDIFIHRYQQQDHGCRDPRPQHWRHYL